MDEETRNGQMSDDLFENAANELEKSMKEEEQSTPPSAETLAKAIRKGITDAVAPLLKGGPTSDMSAEADKRGTLTDTSSDPAEKPKKSGGGYPDSKSYTSKKGDDDFNDDDDDGDDDDTPSFFKKKKKRKGKKACKGDEDYNDDRYYEDDDDDAYDASEFIDGMSKAVDHLSKSNNRLEEGLSVFGELLSELADPRRDKLAVNMAKAMTHIVDRVTKLEKAITEQNDLVKSMARMPGAPKIAGATQLNLIKGEEESEDATPKVSQEDRDRLFKAAVEGRISQAERRNAVVTGDLSCLKKAAES